MAKPLSKEQQTLLAFFSRIPKTQRMIALNIVRALAEDSGNIKPVDSDDTPESNERVIHLEGGRAERVHSILADATDCIVSLKTAAKLFPNNTAIAEGQMHPTSTMLAFATTLGTYVEDLMDIAWSDDIRQLGSKA